MSGFLVPNRPASASRAVSVIPYLYQAGRTSTPYLFSSCLDEPLGHPLGLYESLFVAAEAFFSVSQRKITPQPYSILLSVNIYDKLSVSPIYSFSREYHGRFQTRLAIMTQLTATFRTGARRHKPPLYVSARYRSIVLISGLMGDAVCGSRRLTRTDP